MMTREEYDLKIAEVEQALDNEDIKTAAELLSDFPLQQGDGARNEHLYLAGFVSGHSIALNELNLPPLTFNYDLSEISLVLTDGNAPPRALSEMVSGFIAGVVRKKDESRTPVIN